MTDLMQKWSCEYCTYENWPASKKCVLCRAQKPPQLIDEGVYSMEQNIYQMAPLICSDSQGSSSSSSSSQSSISVQSSHNSLVNVNSKWSCQTCTYLNWPKATKCTQCLTPRPNIPMNKPLSVDVSISIDPSGGCTKKNSPSSPEAAKALNNDINRAVATVGKVQIKWSCKICTYENWMRATKCVLCGASRTNRVNGDKENYVNLENDSKRSSPVITPKHHAQLSTNCAIIEDIENFHIGGTASSSNRHQGKRNVQDHGNNVRVSRNEEKKLHQIRNCFRDTNWLWLNACRGVIDEDVHAVEAYLAAGGDPARQLTTDESDILGRPGVFVVGFSLIHLAISFKKENILAALLAATDVVTKARKRVPSYIAPDIALEIMREASLSLRQRKGDFPCYFLMDLTTFALPADIEDLPNTIKNQLFEELLDKNVQAELENEEPVINWCSELTDRLGSRLYPLWNRTAGDCLLDSALQASWGVMDRDNILRHALSDSLNEGALMFYRRWKETETMQAELLHFSLDDNQWEQDWATILGLASQPGASLEQIHIFALAHILRRPIIVYGIKFVKSLHGDNIGLARFQGVYLPLLWEQSFCWRTPVALGYTRGHFSALVPMEVDAYANIGARANISNSDDDDDIPVAYLPLIDCEGKILPIHFLQATEQGHEELMLHEWLECCVTNNGILVCKQRLSKPPLLVRQMVDEWLHWYRNLAQVVQSATAVSDSSRVNRSNTGALSSDEDTDDE